MVTDKTGIMGEKEGFRNLNCICLCKQFVKI